MPYLEQQFVVYGELVQAGTWVPELGWQRWNGRAHGLEPSMLSWRRAWGSIERTDPSPLPDPYLKVLAQDIADAQRDGVLYTNLLERLKNSPDDGHAADAVVEQMRTLGLASVDWPEEIGGPPRGQSPIPFKPMLSWLWRQLKKVGTLLLAAVDSARTILTSIGISAVALELSLSPGVSFELSTEMIGQVETWQKAKEFFVNLRGNLAEDVF